MKTEILSLKPERLAQLEAYAQRRGKDAVTVLDDVLADYLAAAEQQEDAMQRRLSPEEWETEFESWADSFPQTRSTPLPDGALSRESLNPDRV